MTGVPLDGVIELEEKILKADLAANKSQAQILSEGITQSEGGIDILNQLILQQKDVVQNSKEDVERIATLRKRGLNTESDFPARRTVLRPNRRSFSRPLPHLRGRARS